MYDELLKEVRKGLAARKNEWPQIAAALGRKKPRISLSFIEKVGRGKYDSEPHFKRLERIAEYLRATSVPQP